MQIRRDVAALHRQRRFDESRDSGRRLQVTEIGLNRPKRAIATAAAIRGRQRLEFDRIP
jgi:hypothetical protein